MNLSKAASRIASAVYRRIDRRSTWGVPWRFDGPNVTFTWEGFVDAPSAPMLFARHHYETALIRRLLEKHPKGRTLEFGCGFGRLSPTFASVSTEHVGVDVNRDAVSLAQATYPELTFLSVAGAGAPLPFPDASFDLIATWTVLQHVPPALFDATLRDIKRVAKPDAWFLLCEETRMAGVKLRHKSRAHTWHRHADDYAAALAPARRVHSDFIQEIDRLPGITSPGRVMLFTP